jgi:hypothetical protein
MTRAPNRQRILVALGLFLATALPVAADSITLLNGVVLTGTVSRAGSDGLDFETAGRQRTYAWSTLAPGTRFRYDPAYRANLQGYLEGRATASLTNAPDAQYQPVPRSPAPAP